MPVLVDPALPTGTLRRLAQPTLVLDDGLVARPWRADDAAAVRRCFDDPGIQQWHVRRLDTEDEAREWVAQWPQRWNLETDASWAIARADDDEVVGQVGFRVIRLDEARANMSYWVAPAARGKGIAGRAAAALACWGMEVVGFERLSLVHAVSNLPSCRIAEAAGFDYEGTLRRYGLHADGWHDMHMHARTARRPD